MCPWPWERKCSHLVRYDGNSIEVSGLSLPPYLGVGKIAIEPKLVQAVSHALMLIDASQYYLCQSVRDAPDEETKKKYYELMMQDRLRAQDIIMGLAAFSISPQSKNVEEGLMKMLLQNHGRALQIEEEKIGVSPETAEPNSPSRIEISSESLRDKIIDLQKSDTSYTSIFEQSKKTKANSSKMEPVGIFHLLKERFNISQLKTLCFEYGIEYEDIPGENKDDKVRELVLDLDRKDKLEGFYEFLTEYLSRRG